MNLNIFRVDRDSRILLDSEGGVFELEEGRRYEVDVDDRQAADVAELDARALSSGDAGWNLLIGRWASPRALVLRIRRQGRSHAETRIRVIPRGEKLSESLWASMLGEIEAWLPGRSVGIEAGRLGSVGHHGVAAPLIAEALAPLVPDLIQAVRAVLERPRLQSAVVFENVLLRETRRADRDAVRWAGSHPDVAHALDHRRDETVPSLDPQIPQPKVEERVDHPVNQYLAWLLARIAKGLRSTSSRLASLGESADDPDGGAWCSSRALRLEQAAAAIEALVLRSFLRVVPPSPPSEAALLVLLDDPLYARVHALGRRFASPLFQLNEVDHHPAAATRPTFDLYELWSLLALQRQFRTILHEWRWSEYGLANLLALEGTGAGAGFIGVSPSGDVLRLEFNPTFPGWFARGDRPRFSLSSERRPDLVVTFRRADGFASWALLDAKWRVGRQNLGQAFESIHIYRDALRDAQFGGKCRVAALLAPSTTDDSAEWFEAPFQDAHACGVWELKPGVRQARDVGSWLAEQLQLATSECG
jgi:hypothetical protein